MKRILKVGLTGNMGCGKSEVRRALERMGYPTIDADSLAKQIAVSHPEAVREIKTRFGDEVYHADGSLNRRLLAEKVFGDAEALAALNRILHPRVMQDVDRQLRELARQDKIVAIIEAALFYETGWDRDMDAMVVVYAPLEDRIRWIMQRDGSTREQILARMAHQMPLEEKVKRADFVVQNTGSLKHLHEEVQRLHRWLQAQRQKL
ncbi:MAG: dephospho-CoA kinase [candidate division KSB1 bacterium]|nr:dephospho-CoA kinase [candidate division KSB1 bacterium]MDQ7064424.1 dephospho-CoA kinase [candidate division KSB1 bacterium]